MKRDTDPCLDPRLWGGGVMNNVVLEPAHASLLSNTFSPLTPRWWFIHHWTYSFQGNWQMLGSRHSFPQNWLLNLYQDTAAYKKYRDTWTKFNIHCILDDILFILSISGTIMSCWRNPIFIVPFFQLFSRLEIFRSKKISIYMWGKRQDLEAHNIRTGRDVKAFSSADKKSRMYSVK